MVGESAIKTRKFTKVNSSMSQVWNVSIPICLTKCFLICLHMSCKYHWYLRYILKCSVFLQLFSIFLLERNNTVICILYCLFKKPSMWSVIVIFSKESADFHNQISWHCFTFLGQILQVCNTVRQRQDEWIPVSLLSFLPIWLRTMEWDSTHLEIYWLTCLVVLVKW